MRNTKWRLFTLELINLCNSNGLEVTGIGGDCIYARNNGYAICRFWNEFGFRSEIKPNLKYLKGYIAGKNNYQPKKK